MVPVVSSPLYHATKIAAKKIRNGINLVSKLLTTNNILLHKQFQGLGKNNMQTGRGKESTKERNRGEAVGCILLPSRPVPSLLHRDQTSEAFFVLFSVILFNIKWKHGYVCIEKLPNVTSFSFSPKNE